MRNIVSILLILNLGFMTSDLCSRDILKEVHTYAYLNGIKLAKSKTQIHFYEDEYKINFEAKSSGAVGLILSWQQVALVRGLSNLNNLLSPREYYSKDKRKKKIGHMHLKYKNKIPKIISAKPDPRDDTRRNIISDNVRYETLDPISAIISIGINLNKDKSCNKIIPVFDGKRRYDIITKDLGNDKITYSKFINKNSILKKCRLEVKRINGYTKKELKKFPREGFIWFDQLIENILYYPIKIQIKTRFGDFTSYTIKNY